MNKTIEAQRGAVAIIVAISMVALLAITALAVDVGHVFVVRNQTQNAADAAALRGASFLYAPGSGSPNFSSNGPAVTNATSTVPLNISVTSNDTLSVQANYWQSLNASAPTNEAAVEVDITKQVQLYFAPVFGMYTTNVSAKAVAVVQSPTAVGPGGLNVPVVIGSCMYNNFWDSSNNQPKDDPETHQPYVFQIGTSYAYNANAELGGTCTTGQWTPLTSSQDESDSTIQHIIDNGNTSTVKTGDNLWLQNGDKNNLYNLINNCSESGNRSCEFSTVPVVSSVTPGSQQPVLALACMHVLSATGGSGKYITVQMSTGCSPSNASGGSGTNYGVVGPPRLAQ
jgi:Flp pilus assembly protein TadG